MRTIYVYEGLVEESEYGDIMIGEDTFPKILMNYENIKIRITIEELGNN